MQKIHGQCLCIAKPRDLFQSTTPMAQSGAIIGRCLVPRLGRVDGLSGKVRKEEDTCSEQITTPRVIAAQGADAETMKFELKDSAPSFADEVINSDHSWLFVVCGNQTVEMSALGCPRSRSESNGSINHPADTTDAWPTDPLTAIEELRIAANEGTE